MGYFPLNKKCGYDDHVRLSRYVSVQSWIHQGQFIFANVLILEYIFEEKMDRTHSAIHVCTSIRINSFSRDTYKNRRYIYSQPK
jgi:hypothetical protein